MENHRIKYQNTYKELEGMSNDSARTILVEILECLNRHSVVVLPEHLIDKE